jgi:hypothetical protein
MKMLSKILIVLSNAIIIYFIVGGLAFRAGQGGLQRCGSVLMAPLSFMWDNITIVRHNVVNYGIQNAFLPPGLVRHKSHPNFKYWVNNLQKDLFVFHVESGTDNLHLVDVRSGKSLRTITLPYISSKSDRRWMVFVDSKEKAIHAYLSAVPNTLFKLDYSGSILQKTTFDFSLHHRLDVDDGHIFLNIRRKIKNMHQDFNDEGYVELDANYKIVVKFWLGDHLDEFPKLGSSISVNLWKDDPFHLNDVQVVAKGFGQMGNQNLKLNAGDVLLSSRHLNSIIIIRDKKIWSVEQGTFNLQHDVDVINDSIISISNNNSSCVWVGLCDLSEIRSNVIHFNVRTGEEVIKFDNVGFSTQTEGQVQYLGSGLVVIENQNSNEFIVLQDDKVVFRGGIMSKSHSGFYDYLTWEQFSENNPFR